MLRRVYERLLRRFGHAGWWPGGTPFEVCLGAILTQNTSWSNVEKALAVLRDRDLLSFSALDRLSEGEIAPLIRSSGCFNVKARRVRAFLDFLGRTHGGRAEGMAGTPAPALREQLLAVPGIGPETADAIGLYAAGHPVFVVDAYTRRLLVRLGRIRGDESYAEVQRHVASSLPAHAALFNDYHAQIVQLGKRHCRVRPLCDGCPLEDLCPKRGVAGTARATMKTHFGGVTVSTGTSTPRGAGRACLPTRKSGGKP
jgi:endonuclease-3 related protein